QTDIENTIEQTKAITGGDWSVYVTIPSTGDTLSINQKKMQAASVIKMFVMGAVYENYDDLKKEYPDEDIDYLIEYMIIVSDNESADTLVTMLGKGDSIKGRKIVTDFCHDHGFTNTNMGRMILEDNVTNDNYTTTEDMAKFLEMLLNGELAHSKEMLRHLQNQERTTKIPAGIPIGVTTANKTGELEDVQNDAAIIFAKRPYIICVMSDGVLDYQTPIDGIVDISKETYDYLVTKM
ncbi:MAG: serine hydrolase, partial [Clostridia bacterium]|nr:serine hydrolase [Clostridia bacterium]